MLLSDKDGLTAASHALAFDHLSVVKELPLSLLSTENLNLTISKKVGGNKKLERKGKEIGRNGQEENDQIIEESDQIIDGSSLGLGSGLGLGLKQIIERNSRSALHIVSQWGSIRCLEFLLGMNLHHNSNPNENPIFDPSLLISNTDSILLKPDPNPNPFSNSNSNIDLNPNIDINIKMHDGTTPLHLAARYGHIDCLKLLIKNNADPYGKDCLGNNALKVAQIWGREECVTYLSEIAKNSSLNSVPHPVI
jgi:ankyrin repeat protein